jgi:hypothetical protein
MNRWVWRGVPSIAYAVGVGRQPNEDLDQRIRRFAGLAVGSGESDVVLRDFVGDRLASGCGLSGLS